MQNRKRKRSKFHLRGTKRNARKVEKSTVRNSVPRRKRSPRAAGGITIKANDLARFPRVSFNCLAHRKNRLDLNYVTIGGDKVKTYTFLHTSSVAAPRLGFAGSCACGIKPDQLFVLLLNVAVVNNALDCILSQ